MTLEGGGAWYPGGQRTESSTMSASSPMSVTESFLGIARHRDLCVHRERLALLMLPCAACQQEQQQSSLLAHRVTWVASTFDALSTMTAAVRPPSTIEGPCERAP